MKLSIVISLYLPVCAYVCLPTYPPAFLTTCPPAFQTTYPPAYLPTYLLTYLPTYSPSFPGSAADPHRKIGGNAVASVLRGGVAAGCVDDIGWCLPTGLRDVRRAYTGGADGGGIPYVSSVRFDSVRFDPVRFGSVRFGLVWFGWAWFGSVGFC